MKNKILFTGLLFASILLAASATMTAFKGVETNEAAVTAKNEAIASSYAGSIAYKAFTLDTLSNALKDTLAVPYTFASRYTYSVHLTLATISGTRAMKVYLDEANVLSGSTGWLAVDSIIPTASVNEYKMDGAEVYGRKHRIRVSGNAAATQSVSYRLTALYKPQ